MTRAQRMFCELLIVVGLLAAIWVAVGRVMVEQMNNTVGMAVDWREVQEVAAATGVSPRHALFTLQSGGATHLAVAEQSLADLIDRGDVKLFARGDEVDILAADASVIQQLARGLRARFPGSYELQHVAENEIWLTVPAGAVLDRRVGAGYPREALEAASHAGLPVVARPRATGVRTPVAVQHVMEQVDEIDAAMTVFSGERVVGFPRLVPDTADAMRQAEIIHGMLEMAPQYGSAELSTRLDHQVVRVHAITETEMQTMPMPRAVERFVRATRERGIRLLYVRLLPTAGDNPLEGNAVYLSAMREQLRSHGFFLGRPRPMKQFSTAPWILAIVNLAVCGALLWLGQALLGLPGREFWPVALAVIVGATAMLFVATDPARQLMALVGAIIFPIIAAGWTARGLTRVEGEPRLGMALGRLLAAFLAVTVITAFGGLLVVGLLGDSAFFVKVAQFRGVKIAHLLPILTVAVLWLARSMSGYRDRLKSVKPDEMVDYHTGDTVPELPPLWAGLRQALEQFVAYWHVAVALAALAALGMLVVRSGHEITGAVLPMEMELRTALDRLLSVRPRSKEVFLGHPVMLLALLLTMRGVRPGVWIAFAVGVIGQVSLLNSFCHVHTPLLLTILRVFNGVWVGALGGLILCALWDWFGGAPEPTPQPSLPLDEDDEDV